MRKRVREMVEGKPPKDNKTKTYVTFKLNGKLNL